MIFSSNKDVLLSRSQPEEEAFLIHKVPILCQFLKSQAHRKVHTVLEVGGLSITLSRLLPPTLTRELVWPSPKCLLSRKQKGIILLASWDQEPPCSCNFPKSSLRPSEVAPGIGVTLPFVCILKDIGIQSLTIHSLAYT